MRNNRLFKKCENFINENNLISKNGSYLIALSGGGDSTFLLYLFDYLRKKYSLKLEAIYIDHGVRKRIEIESEIKIIQENCEKTSIPLIFEKIDRKIRLSEENMREARYEIFKKLTINSKKIIVTGHTESDQVETFFLRLFRGSGLNGIGGIPVKRENIIRPILNITSDEIRNFLKGRNIIFSIDSTNFDTKYDRNKLRINILPNIRKNFPAFEKRVVEFMSLASSDNSYLEEESIKIIDKYLYKNVFGYSFKIDEINHLSPSIISRFLILIYEKILGTRKKLSSKHIRMMIEIINGTILRSQLHLPGEVRIERENNLVIFRKIEKENVEFNFKIDGDSEIVIPITGEIVKISTIDIEEFKMRNSFEKGIEYFDYGLIKFPIIIRNRMSGDRLKPFGLSGTKKVKKIMGEKRIAKISRNYVPIIVNGDEKILAVGRYLRSEVAPISEKTEKILKIEFINDINLLEEF